MSDDKDPQRISDAADNCEVLRARLAKYEDAEGRPVGLTHDQAELVGLVRDLALRAGKHARPLIHAAALGLESQAREIERLKAWKSEEMEVMTPLLDYARSVCQGPLGCSITEWLVSDHKRLAALETQPSGVDQRAAFEAHMISEGYMSKQFKRAEDDKYENPYLQDYYELWMARAALSAPSHGEQVRESEPDFYWVEADEGSWNSPEEWAQDYYDYNGEKPESVSFSCAVELPTREYDSFEFDANGNCISCRLVNAAPSAGSQQGVSDGN